MYLEVLLILILLAGLGVAIYFLVKPSSKSSKPQPPKPPKPQPLKPQNDKGNWSDESKEYVTKLIKKSGLQNHIDMSCISNIISRLELNYDSINIKILDIKNLINLLVMYFVKDPECSGVKGNWTESFKNLITMYCQHLKIPNVCIAKLMVLSKTESPESFIDLMDAHAPAIIKKYCSIDISPDDIKPSPKSIVCDESRGYLSQEDMNDCANNWPAGCKPFDCNHGEDGCLVCKTCRNGQFHFFYDSSPWLTAPPCP
jgi:hypothetical protein